MAEFKPEFGASNLLYGQTVDQDTGVAIPFVEFSFPYSDGGNGKRVTGYEGNVRTEITPKNDTEAQIRITDPDNEIGDVLDAILIANAVTIPAINFPPTLTDVTVTFNTNLGAGEDSHPASQQSFEVFGNGSGSLNPTSSSQGSASVTPDAQPIIEEPFNENVDAMEYTFYMEDGANAQEVRDRLGALLGGSILPWPQFNPETVTLTIKGQSASVSAKADTRVFGGGSPDNGQAGYEWGNGTSKETGTQTRTLRISATLHDEITIDTPSHTESAEAAADASTDIFLDGFAAEQPAIPNAPTVSADVTGSVTPTTIPATDPVAVPISGVYAKSITPGPSRFGIRTSYQVVTVDFGTLQTV